MELDLVGLSIDPDPYVTNRRDLSGKMSFCLETVAIFMDVKTLHKLIRTDNQGTFNSYRTGSTTPA